MFPEVHHQFTIGLLAVTRDRAGTGGVTLRGPYAGRREWDSTRRRVPQRIAASEVLSWTTLASLPLLPHEDSVAAFTTLRLAPRMGERDAGTWRVRAEQELNATSDRGLMEVEPERRGSCWPVMKGESFDVWENDRGPTSYFAWAKPAPVHTHLLARRLKGAKRGSNSTYAEFSPNWLRDSATLPCLKPRIAFRDVSRATDSRTVRAALIPPNAFVVHTAPHLLWPKGDEKDQAFLLGVLCSVPLDWYARRFVELHLTFGLLYDLPIPRPPRTNPHWQRAVALAAPDDRFSEWAAAVGVPHGPLDPHEKRNMIEELDAVVAHLYGLTPAQLAHVFDTFHEWTREEQQREWDARRDRTVARLERLL